MFQTILPCLQAGKGSAAALMLSWGVYKGGKREGIWMVPSKNCPALTDPPKDAPDA